MLKKIISALIIGILSVTSFVGCSNKDEKNEIIGEESRLLYVALTRCKRNLYLNMEGNIAATEKINTWKSLVGGVIEYV